MPFSSTSHWRNPVVTSFRSPLFARQTEGALGAQASHATVSSTNDRNGKIGHPGKQPRKPVVRAPDFIPSTDKGPPPIADSIRLAPGVTLREGAIVKAGPKFDPGNRVTKSELMATFANAKPGQKDGKGGADGGKGGPGAKGGAAGGGKGGGRGGAGAGAGAGAGPGAGPGDVGATMAAMAAAAGVKAADGGAPARRPRGECPRSLTHLRPLNPCFPLPVSIHRDGRPETVL